MGSLSFARDRSRRLNGRVQKYSVYRDPLGLSVNRRFMASSMTILMSVLSACRINMSRNSLSVRGGSVTVGSTSILLWRL